LLRLRLLLLDVFQILVILLRGSTLSPSEYGSSIFKSIESNSSSSLTGSKKDAAEIVAGFRQLFLYFFQTIIIHTLARNYIGIELYRDQKQEILFELDSCLNSLSF
jgi:hypothetical protein